MRWITPNPIPDWRQRERDDAAVLHERRWLKDQKVGWRESTPLGELVPVSTGFGATVDNLIGMRTSMAQYREDQLQQQARSILDVMGNEPDEIPM